MRGLKIRFMLLGRDEGAPTTWAMDVGGFMWLSLGTYGPAEHLCVVQKRGFCCVYV